MWAGECLAAPEKVFFILFYLLYLLQQQPKYDFLASTKKYVTGEVALYPFPAGYAGQKYRKARVEGCFSERS